MNQPRPSFEMVGYNSHAADSEKDHQEHQPRASGTQRRKQGFPLWMEMLRGDDSGRGGFLTGAAFVSFQLNVSTIQEIHQASKSANFQKSLLARVLRTMLLLHHLLRYFF